MSFQAKYGDSDEEGGAQPSRPRRPEAAALIPLRFASTEVDETSVVELIRHAVS